jgi:hypothetical protein
VFAAVGLEPLVPADFDWFFAGSQPRGRRLERELDRRRLGEILISDDPAAPLEAGLYGVLTNRPSEFLRRLNSAPAPVR